MSEQLESDAGTGDNTALRADCYAGHRADAEPRRLRNGLREVLVTEIVDPWLAPTRAASSCTATTAASSCCTSTPSMTAGQ